MDKKNLLDYMASIGTIVTPLLILFLTAIGWLLKTRLQRQDQLEDHLRLDRIENYNQILEPFIILLTPDQAWESDPKNKNKDKNKIALKILLSMEYRKKRFSTFFDRIRPCGFSLQ